VIAQSLSEALARRGIHYAWVVAGVVFLNAIFGAAALGVPAVLIAPMAADLGLTVGEMSAPQGVRFALFGLVAPFAGGLVVRYGLVRMMLIAGALIVAGLAMAAAMTTVWEMWLAVGVLLGVAPGLVAMQVNAAVASRWFVARRGLVLGVLGGAMAAGTLVFIPPAAWVAETFGWRAALLIPTVGTALVLPLVHLLMRERPSDLGLPAYGDDAVRPVPPRLPGNFVQVSVGALALAVRRPVFWVLAGTFAVCGATSLGITQTHLVPFCGDIGISLVAASWLLAVIGVCDLIGTIASGWLSDRYDNRWLLVWYYGFRGVSLLWLAFGDTTLAGLAIFAIVFGLDYIATVPPTTKLTIAAFGRETGPVVIAWIFAAHQIGAGAMAYGAGLGRDGFGSYLPVFFVAGLLCLVAAATFVLVRRERPALA
jgi:predicted MFS family arabinose efflux permease